MNFRFNIIAWLLMPNSAFGSCTWWNNRTTQLQIAWCGTSCKQTFSSGCVALLQKWILLRVNACVLRKLWQNFAAWKRKKIDICWRSDGLGGHDQEIPWTNLPPFLDPKHTKQAPQPRSSLTPDPARVGTKMVFIHTIFIQDFTLICEFAALLACISTLLTKGLTLCSFRQRFRHVSRWLLIVFVAVCTPGCSCFFFVK